MQIKELLDKGDAEGRAFAQAVSAHSEGAAYERKGIMSGAYGEYLKAVKLLIEAKVYKYPAERLMLYGYMDALNNILTTLYNSPGEDNVNAKMFNSDKGIDAQDNELQADIDTIEEPNLKQYFSIIIQNRRDLKREYGQFTEEEMVAIGQNRYNIVNPDEEPTPTDPENLTESTNPND